MKNIWLCICYDSDGACETPRFFKTRNDIIDYIRKEANDTYLEIEDMPEASIEIDCLMNNKLYAQVHTDEMSWIWRGFNVSENIYNL